MASCKQDYLAKWHFLLIFWYILIFWAQKCWFIELNVMLIWDMVCWYFSKKNNQRLFTYVVQALQATKIYILIAQNKMKNTFSLFFFYNSSFIGWLPICCYTNFTKKSLFFVKLKFYNCYWLLLMRMGMLFSLNIVFFLFLLIHYRKKFREISSRKYYEIQE